MNRIKIIISNPGIGSHVRQSVKAYFASGLLYRFYSSFVLNNSKLTAFLVSKIRSLKSKQFEDIPDYRIKKLIFPEILRLISSRLFSKSITDKVWEWSELLFDRWVANQINKDIDIFHGYEHASYASLKKCKSLGVFSVYEQPSAHHLYHTKNILKLLFESEEYFRSNFSGLYDSELSNKRNQRRDDELRLADLIVCNSTYVKNTLIDAGISASKIITYPLGFPKVKETTIENKSKYRFIVSGNLSYLKGTHHVLRVWKSNPNLFANHELVCIGTDTLSPDEWVSLPDNVIKKDRMNSEDYLRELSSADIYILNTYSDGFGMVLSEAMSNGLAVIGTTNCAAIDIINNAKSGKVIPVGDETALLNAMKWMIENPNETMQMRISAIDYARTHSWENYRTQLPILILERYNKFKINA